uniref:Uncharacterized protein n=1 Tax=Zea mays TaxID=4577 RepID=B6U567_MAIZE|nr:hypothetical protein [Zea mays]|eukprot:NP_001145025.1 uncharacterized protein LOC100278197 [Zea mays]
MPPIPKALRFSFPFLMACEINVNQIKRDGVRVHYAGCKQARERMREGLRTVASGKLGMGTWRKAKLNFFVSSPVMEGLICFGLSLCLSFLLLSTTPSSSFFCLQCCFKR